MFDELDYIRLEASAASFRQELNKIYEEYDEIQGLFEDEDQSDLISLLSRIELLNDDITDLEQYDLDDDYYIDHEIDRNLMDDIVDAVLAEYEIVEQYEIVSCNQYDEIAEVD